MRYTNIVTSIIKHQEKILLLKRSNSVKTMKNMWSGVSGLIENDDESPLSRAKIEIFEEIGLVEKNIELLKSNPQTKIDSPQYKNHTWNIFPFLFKAETSEIKLNWENSEFVWIEPNEIVNYETVPALKEILFNLL
jgi:8-oxo-dGTP pyrophosphatase MutT (NUDIX family)